ncbi:MAG: hypothetical protein KY053_00720 [Candidatus Liptonbacteria bacterium]|nr:hypothetical protein [Candidatus Liptonbacteria bacterium]
MTNKKLFAGRKIVIATMHKKEHVIAPLLEQQLGVTTVVADGLNTDKFGTFTREIKRIDDQLETARKKAYAAMELTKTDLAIASEGSFSPHPSVPFIQSSLELVLFIDKKHGLEIKGHHRASETNMNGEYATNIAEVINFATKHNFPETGIILRFGENIRFGIYKNILTLEELSYQAKKMFSYPFVKKIFIETDMRAHKNPIRMKAIEKATIDLLKNIQSVCPECKTPGFVAVDFEKGLPCSLCKIPTDLPIYDIYHCEKCGFSTQKPVTKYGDLADPKYCGHCNP